MYFSFVSLALALCVAPFSCIVNPFKTKLQTTKPLYVFGFDGRLLANVGVGRRFLTAVTNWLVENDGLNQKGIYRPAARAPVYGGDRSLFAVLEYFDKNPTADTIPEVMKENVTRWYSDHSKDINHYISGLIKQFFSNIHGGAIPVVVANFMSVRKQDTCYKVKKIVDQIPEDNRKLLKILFEHLKAVSANSDTNSMDAAKLGLAIGPILFPPRTRSEAWTLSEKGAIRKGHQQSSMATVFINNPQFITEPPVEYCSATRYDELLNPKMAPSNRAVSPFRCLKGLKCFRPRSNAGLSALGFDVDVGRRFLTAATKWMTDNDGLKQEGIYRAPPATPCYGDTSLFAVLAYFADMVSTKILIQDLWKLGLDWDSEVPVDVRINWKSILHQLQAVSSIKVPRLVPNRQTELHVFADASQKAYGAAAYLRSRNGNEIVSSLLCSKSRVAPVKKVSIPRLELVALVMGSKLAKFIRKCIPHISQVTLWSDSQVTLCWIANPPTKQDVFVKNRVSLIIADKFTVRYCPTTDNPADLCSRGIDTEKLIHSKLWWNGPPWLSRPTTSWPAQPAAPKTDAEPTVLTTTQVNPPVDPSTPFTMDLERYSSLTRLLRTTAYCQRYVDRLRNQSTFIPGSPLNADEVFLALNNWIKWVQQATYYKEIKLIRQGQSNPFIKQLQLFECDGVLRCKGRFLHAKITVSAKSPVLLPKKHYLTDLIILHYHVKLLHQGVRHTVTLLRQDFWIPNIRQEVRPVLRKCRICIHWEGPRCRLPISAPLPVDRLTQSPPFTFTGCDFAGPLLVFDGPSASKAYICLFTCAVTRAVHLELVNDLTSTSFLLALRRFISRRGVPSKIISDNAKTFKLAKTAIERLWHDVVISAETCDYVSSHCIKWQFNVERAPWWGGFFERMVGLVKRTLLKTAGKSKLSSVEVTTIFTEIEAVLNSRPLTFVYSDSDAGQPLTPNNFLLHGQASGMPTYKADPDPDFGVVSSASVLLRSMSSNHRLLDYYWSIWHEEYLAHLREFHQYWRKKQGIASTFPGVGDIVLIKEEGQKRAKWKIGIIEKTYSNKDDGVVRSAQVRNSNTILQRPTSLLYPLEIHTQVSQPKTTTDTDATVKASVRPQRLSAKVAKMKIKKSLK